jgi:hypothetical protein
MLVSRFIFDCEEVGVPPYLLLILGFRELKEIRKHANRKHFLMLNIFVRLACTLALYWFQRNNIFYEGLEILRPNFMYFRILISSQCVVLFMCYFYITVYNNVLQ